MGDSFWNLVRRKGGWEMDEERVQAGRSRGAKELCLSRAGAEWWVAAVTGR